jgi:hypothetical protein
MLPERTWCRPFGSPLSDVSSPLAERGGRSGSAEDGIGSFAVSPTPAALLSDVTGPLAGSSAEGRSGITTPMPRTWCFLWDGSRT